MPEKDNRPKCERCDTRQDALHVAPDSGPVVINNQIEHVQVAVCDKCYAEAFRKTYPDAEIPEQFAHLDTAKAGTVK